MERRRIAINSAKKKEIMQIIGTTMFPEKGKIKITEINE